MYCMETRTAQNTCGWFELSIRSESKSRQPAACYIADPLATNHRDQKQVSFTRISSISFPLATRTQNRRRMFPPLSNTTKNCMFYLECTGRCLKSVFLTGPFERCKFEHRQQQQKTCVSFADFHLFLRRVTKDVPQ